MFLVNFRLSNTGLPHVNEAKGLKFHSVKFKFVSRNTELIEKFTYVFEYKLDKTLKLRALDTEIFSFWVAHIDEKTSLSLGREPNQRS